MDPIFTSLLVVLAICFLVLFFVHLLFRTPRLVETGSPADFGLAYQVVRIPTVQDKQLFAWWLSVSAQAPTAILLHGWGGNAEFMLPLAAPFHDAGVNVLLLDARNHGQSDSVTFSSMPRFAEDVGCAIAWLKTRADTKQQKIILLGHSVGAGAVIYEASKREDISAVISISAFAHPEWMMQRYLEKFLLPRLFIKAINRYVEWIIRHRFDEIAPMNTACRVSCPLLLIHGKADAIVPVTDASVILANCNSDSITLLVFDKAGHDSVDMVKDHGHKMIDFLKKVKVVAE
jgi:pimeloyl-ACP methyl ester carboxylesterase